MRWSPSTVPRPPHTASGRRPRHTGTRHPARPPSSRTAQFQQVGGSLGLAILVTAYSVAFRSAARHPVAGQPRLAQARQAVVRGMASPSTLAAVPDMRGRRAIPGPRQAAMSWRVSIIDGEAIVGLRWGARPLHRRAYRQATVPGALHPPVAAAMAAISGARHGVLLDPFCGSGTILIESTSRHPGN